MAQYVDIPEPELIGFLIDHRFIAVGVEGTTERVFGACRRLVHTDKQLVLTVRVYTTLVAGGQRANGEDAIRVSIWMKLPDLKTGHAIPVMIKGFKRVHRVAGWKRNLTKRIEEAFAVKIAACPTCGSILVERMNRRTQTPFMGCVRYPDCKFIRSIPTGD